MADRGQRFTIPAPDADFANPLAVVDALGWLAPGIQGKHVLCLAAGGGKHAPLYAAAGAIVTVVDISSAMLELDRQVANERGLSLRTVETSMDDLGGLDSGSFDVVIHPVSTCYVPEIAPVYREVARVTAPSGLYISQHKTPINLQASQFPMGGSYSVETPYYQKTPLAPVAGSRTREEGTLEFLHRWEEILGEMCRAGFWIEDVVEPLHAKRDAPPGDFEHRCLFLAPYVRVKARRRNKSRSENVSPRLIIPK